MWIVDVILRRKTVVGLRKRYDKLREKVDRFPVIEKRIELLRLLDRIEPYITSLEEHHMSRFEKRKIIEIVHIDLEKMKALLEKEKRHSVIRNQAQ